MNYCVEYYEYCIYQEFATYREAEIYCAEHNISYENIYNISEGF